jgi:hypothetical protein
MAAMMKIFLSLTALVLVWIWGIEVLLPTLPGMQ